MKTNEITEQKLNKKERRKEWLENHCQLCEQLGKLTGSRLSGKEISVELMKLERLANLGACASCNGETYSVPGCTPFHFGQAENAWEVFVSYVKFELRKILGDLPPGFFVNQDGRGYALKLEAGSVPFWTHSDWGSYQILSPEIPENL